MEEFLKFVRFKRECVKIRGAWPPLANAYGTGLQIHSGGTGPVTFVWGTILTWGHITRLGGTSSDLGGTVLKRPCGAGPAPTIVLFL